MYKYVKQIPGKISALVVREPSSTQRRDSGHAETFRRSGITKRNAAWDDKIEVGIAFELGITCQSL